MGDLCGNGAYEFWPEEDSINSQIAACSRKYLPFSWRNCKFSFINWPKGIAPSIVQSFRSISTSEPHRTSRFFEWNSIPIPWMGRTVLWKIQRIPIWAGSMLESVLWLWLLFIECPLFHIFMCPLAASELKFSLQIHMRHNTDECALAFNLLNFIEYIRFGLKLGTSFDDPVIHCYHSWAWTCYKHVIR